MLVRVQAPPSAPSFSFLYAPRSWSASDKQGSFRVDRAASLAAPRRTGARFTTLPGCCATQPFFRFAKKSGFEQHPVKRGGPCSQKAPGSAVNLKPRPDCSPGCCPAGGPLFSVHPLTYWDCPGSLKSLSCMSFEQKRGMDFSP